MASLSAHLRQAGDHGRLGFHADCPVCREERLFGALSTESVVTRRARAALLTGVVAASLTTPPAVWGQEADTRQEGVAAPNEPSGGLGTGPSGELEDPAFDPGGETELPFEVGTPHGVPPDGVYDDEGESGQLELEPEGDPDVPPVEPEVAPPTTRQGDSDAPPPGEPAPEPPGTEPSSPPDEALEEPPAGKPDSGRAPAAEERARRKGDSGNRDERARRPAPQPPEPPSGQAPSPPAPVQAVPPPPGAPPAPAQVESAPTSQVTRVAQGDPPAPPPPRDGARVHVVQPGESLWLIAKRALPAGASVARIAREVNRLWELNEDRIATGDPDLLRIGTELRLR